MGADLIPVSCTSGRGQHQPQPKPSGPSSSSEQRFVLGVKEPECGREDLKAIDIPSVFGLLSWRAHIHQLFSYPRDI